MITKLTLTMDDKVIDSAKKYALKQGKSLSGMVEDYFISITSATKKQDKSDIAPEIRKLMGSVSLPRNTDYKKSLVNELNKKYSK